MTHVHYVVQPVGRRGPEGGKGDPGDGATSLTPRIDDLESSTKSYAYFVNATFGNDSYDGLSASFGVASIAGMKSRIKNGRFNFINIANDLPLTAQEYFGGASHYLHFRQTSGGSPGRFVYTGGCLRRFGKGAIVFEDIDIHLDSPSGALGFITNYDRGGDYFLTFRNCTFTQSGTNAAPLIAGSSTTRTEVIFENSPITNIAGKVFLGCPAGTDPNTVYNGGYKTPLTSG